MATLTYKGYTGVLEVDLDAGELFGRTVGISDMITFQGRTVHEARKSFEASVDFYLSCCAEEEKPPDRPYSGRFNVRIAPEVHRKLAILAESRGQSLNELVVAALAIVAGEAPTRVKIAEPTWQEVKAKLEATRPKAKPARTGRRRRGSTESAGQPPSRKPATRPGRKRFRHLRGRALLHRNVVKYSSRSATCWAVRSRSKSSGMSERD
jgi:predicted HicB family RNase H-like nuclease